MNSLRLEDPDSDYSSASTVVHFAAPLPLLRGPVLASAADDPSGSGPYVLAFPNAATWRTAYRRAEAKIFAQCEAGARAGCAISASHKCKPPWWSQMSGTSAVKFEERERCEEQEMRTCLAASKSACVKFAKDKCFPAFGGARIAFSGLMACSQLIMLSAEAENSSHAESAELDRALLNSVDLHRVSTLDNEPTTYRGSLLLNKTPVEDKSVFAE